MLHTVFKKVYRKPQYRILGIVCVTITFLAIVLLPNISLLEIILSSSHIPLLGKGKLFLSLLGSITTSVTLFASIITVITSILFGIYMSMMVYYLKNKIKEVKRGMGDASGIVGLVSGVIGVGCAACGSFLITSLSLVGATGLLTFLPLEGGEFGIIGIVLLGYAVYQLAQKIINPLICNIK